MDGPITSEAGSLIARDKTGPTGLAGALRGGVEVVDVLARYRR